MGSQSEQSCLHASFNVSAVSLCLVQVMVYFLWDIEPILLILKIELSRCWGGGGGGRGVVGGGGGVRMQPSKLQCCI